MKRIICTIIIIAFIFSMPGCNKTTNRNNKDVKSTTSNTTDAMSEKVSIKFSDAEVEKMSNFMNEGRTAISGTWLYGISFDENGNGTLTKIKTDGSEQKRMSSQFARYINIIGGWLYYIGFAMVFSITHCCVNFIKASCYSI